MSSIKGTADQGIEAATKQLTEAGLIRHLIIELPLRVAEFEPDSCYMNYYEYSKELHISVSFWGNDKDTKIREFLEILAQEGAVITAEKLPTGQQYYRPTSRTISAKLGNITIDVKGSALPPSCEIVEEDYVGKKYKVICHGQDTA